MKRIVPVIAALALSLAACEVSINESGEAKGSQEPSTAASPQAGSGQGQSAKPKKGSASPAVSATPAEEGMFPENTSGEVKAVPGYRLGEIPPLPALVLPDVSLLTESAPLFGKNISDSVADLAGVTVSAAVCGADGVPHASTWGIKAVSGGQESAPAPRVGVYESGDLTIVNNGDGTGSLKGGGYLIEVYREGAGSLSGNGYSIYLDGEGGGSLETSSTELHIFSPEAGVYKTNDFRISYLDDGSAIYESPDITIFRDTDGTVRVNGTVVKDAPARAKVPYGIKFPSMDRLSPEVPCGVAVSLAEELLFDFGSDQLRPAGVAALKKLAAGLKGVKIPRVLVHGHTDSVSDDASNLELSQRRAEAVKAVLDGESLPVAVEAKGFGESFPVTPNENSDGSDNPSGRQLNRRAEIIIPVS